MFVKNAGSTPFPLVAALVVLVAYVATRRNMKVNGVRAGPSPPSAEVLATISAAGDRCLRDRLTRRV
jgi:hypothetical protein